MKKYRLKNPEPGEEKFIYIVTNINEVTGRWYIEPVTQG